MTDLDIQGLRYGMDATIGDDEIISDALVGVTAGTVTASKALVVDSSKDLATLGSVTMTTLAATTLGATNIDAGASGTAGSVDVFPSTAAKGKLTLACADQTGDTAVTLQPAAHGQATTVHIPDGGASDAYVVQSTAALTLVEADILDGATVSTAEVNTLAGAVAGATFVIGAEGGNVINVGMQLVDAGGSDIAVSSAIRAYLSDDSDGSSLAVTPPDGGTAIGTDGVFIPVTPALTDALMVDGALAIDAAPEKFKTTQVSAFLINGVSHTKVATTALTFSAAHVISLSKFGVILIQINAAGTISTKVPGSPQAYNDAPTALAALPSPDAGNISLGYIAIENNGVEWTANTDDLTNASDVTTAAFNDTAEVAIGAPKMFELVSESDGDIDINITESGVATWYLILVMPNGSLVASNAITFA
jgi:hypothetical protein